MSCMKKMAEMDGRKIMEFIDGDKVFSAVRAPYYTRKNFKKGCSCYPGNQYQEDAMRTCSINDNDKDKLLHGVFGLNSEAGEIAGLFQKEYQGHQIDKEHLVKECGDCLWMIAEILDAIGVDLETCMMKNIEKLKARYPDGFDPEKSLHRKPGDV